MSRQPGRPCFGDGWWQVGVDEENCRRFVSLREPNGGVDQAKRVRQRADRLAAGVADMAPGEGLAEIGREEPRLLERGTFELGQDADPWNSRCPHHRACEPFPAIDAK